MKRLLIISVVLIVAGIGLILFSDPVLTLATGGGPGPNGNHGPVIFNGTGSTGSTGGGLPAGCQQSGSGEICLNSSGTPGGIGITSSIIFTIAGIGLCGAGLFLTAIESIAKPASPFQTKTVT